ncbi:UNVERIFIED_CONTAM: copper amine oxidase-like protein [Acetivibrio alkalicellulosi]
MKKVTLIVSIVALLMVFTIPVNAVLPLRVVVNGNRIDFPDAQPFIDSNGRTQVPVRFVSEALGANVGWEQSTRTVSIVHTNKRIEIAIGKKEFTIDGIKNEMDTEALIKGDRTFVPIRFISEGLGAKVTWDDDVRTVYIETRDDESFRQGPSDYPLPEDSKVIVANVPGSSVVETSITLMFTEDGYAEQVEDLGYALESKFGKDISEQVVNHVKGKKSRWDEIPEKYIYVKETDQYIWIRKSSGFSVSISVMLPGEKPEE